MSMKDKKNTFNRGVLIRIGIYILAIVVTLWYSTRPLPPSISPEFAFQEKVTHSAIDECIFRLDFDRKTMESASCLDAKKELVRLAAMGTSPVENNRAAIMANALNIGVDNALKAYIDKSEAHLKKLRANVAQLQSVIDAKSRSSAYSR